MTARIMLLMMKPDIVRPFLPNTLAKITAVSEPIKLMRLMRIYYYSVLISKDSLLMEENI